MLPLLLVMLAGALCAGELPMDGGAAGTYHALKRLGTTLSVLHITAHPDDEDAALLTALSRGYGFRTGLFSLNRGEGGANLAGSEMYDALGVLRTEETLAAARIYGVDLFYGSTVDFGFSKRMDETLEHWGREKVLSEVVRFVRLYRPDIIVARFHGKARDGHGNHQTAGLMAIEAFRAAADPKQFPEAGEVWRASKLYLSTRPNEPSTLRIDTGVYDPVLGMSYREAGAMGYRRHRTQGMAAVASPIGPAASTLQLIESRVGPVAAETDIRAGLKDALPLQPPSLRDFNAAAPWKIAPQLAQGLATIRELLEREKDGHARFLLEHKEREYADALHRALGIQMEALVDPAGPVSPFSAPETFAAAVPGQKFAVTLTTAMPGEVKVVFVSRRLLTPPDWTVTPGRADERGAHFDVAIGARAAPTRLHWSRVSEYRDHLYTIEDKRYEFTPFAPAPCMAELRYRYEGVEVPVTVPVRTQTVDRLYGPQRRALVVAPALSVSISPHIGVVPVGATAYPFTVQVRGNAALESVVRLRLPQGWSAEPANATVRFANAGDVQNLQFTLRMPAARPGSAGSVEAVAESGGNTFTEGYQVIGYRGLEPHHLFRPARLEVRGVDVKIAPGIRVGYLPGAGDETGRSLAQLGIPVQTLTPEDLASGDLSGFTAIVVGVRASAVRTDWKTHRERLLQYVHKGGHLIVQYQTQEFDEVPYGPYPYQVTPRAEEVSEEAAKMTILEPAHPVFTARNLIAAADFEGWVEERGSKWMASWDPRYTALLESHDREQAPQKGGMLIAQYGKGYWTYAAWAFYRQLPAGVPGAYRLMANLLSLTGC